MRVPRRELFLIALFFLLSGCNLPRSQEGVLPQATKIVFNPPSASQSPPVPNAPQGTPPPTATVPVWPAPYFGLPGPTQITPVPPAAVPIPRAPGKTFLLVGSDRRGESSSRTDTIIVVNWQSQHNIVSMISIPRDMYVYIPGWRMQRINAAYQHGESNPAYHDGVTLLEDTILYNLGIAIDHTIMVDFSGFQEIFDAVGGVDVPVTCKTTEWRLILPEADPDDEDNWELYTVEPGVVHMDGEFALWYARSRLRSSDYDRHRRQQEILRSLHTQVLSLNLINRLPELYSRLSDSFSSDLTLPDVLDLAPMALVVTSARIRSYFIGSDMLTVWRTPITEAYTTLPDHQKIRTMLLEAFAPPDFTEAANLQTRIEVINRSSNTDWGFLAAERLNYSGFETAITRSTQPTSTPTTLIDLNNERDLTQVELLIDILDLSSRDVLHEPSTNSGYAYRLIVGDDFSPCFRPNKLER